jgi:hypothetical protein
MPDNTVLKSPIFIFGFPRSGTTLLRSILGQHSNISLVNEPELVWALRYAGYDLDSKFSREDRSIVLDKLKRIGLCRKHLENNTGLVTAFINSRETLSFKEVYEKLLPRPNGNQLVWGEKSLNNLFFIGYLLRMYPTAVLIHIVRDARSVVLSNYKKQHRKASGKSPHIDHDPFVPWLQTVLYFAVQARLWKRWMSIARHSMQLIPADNRIEIKYEDLLENPKKCLQSLCDKIGLTYEDRMIDSAARRSDPVLTDRSAYAHEKLAQNLDQSRARSYKDLPDQLVWIIERQAGAMMQQFGYRLICPDLALSKRLALNMALAGNIWRIQREEKSRLRRRLFMA